MAQNTPILGKIKSSESAASLDAKYGPYASKDAANAALGENGDDVITAGLTVGITQSDGSVKEFWYQPDGQGGLQLVEKQVAAQEETDPTVPAWAKAETKPSYTASEVGAIPSSEKGVAGGVATLGSDGKVPQSQLPSYVDDVLEYSNQSSFPATGESGKIYVALDTNKTYRWSGSAYVEISQSLALGETSSTAFAGDRGKAIEDKIPSGASSSNKLATASDLSGKVDKVANAQEDNFASFDANGGIKDSGCNEGSFIKGVKQNGTMITPEGGVVNVTVQDGLSAFEIAQQQGYTGTVDQWLASLKANIGAFKFVNYDGTAESAFTTGGIGTPYSGTIDSLKAGTDTTPDVILLMNNTDGTTPPTKTFMITTQEVTPATMPASYEFVYAGDLQSAMPSNVLTQTNIVNDLTTGGVNDVLSAEAGKALNDKFGEIFKKDGVVVGGTMNATEVQGGEVEVSVSKIKTLNSVAYDGKTYKQIFEDGNMLPITPGFEDGTIGSMVVAGGSPSITTEEKYLGSYALKVSPNGLLETARYIQSGLTLYMAAKVNMVSRTAGYLGLENYTSSSYAAVNTVTDEWVTVSKVFSPSNARAVGVGCFSSANLTGYIDMPVIVDMAIFTSAPTKEEMDALYEEYLEIVAGTVPEENVVLFKVSNPTNEIEEGNGNAVSSGGVYKELNGINEVVIDNTEAVEYYKDYNGSESVITYACLGCSTHKFDRAVSFNRITIPYKSNDSAAQNIPYWIYVGDGSSTGLRNPSNTDYGTIVHSGVIAKPLRTVRWDELNLELPEVIDVPVGYVVAVYFSVPYSNISLYGKGYSGSDQQKYADVQSAMYLTSNTNNAIAATWNRGGGGDGAMVAVYPKLDLVVTSHLDEVLSGHIRSNEGGLATAIHGAMISAPDTINAVVGDTLQVFYRGIVRAVNPYNYDIRIKANVGKTYPRYWEFTPTAAGTEIITVSLLDNAGVELDKKEISVVIASSPTSPSGQVNVFCLGDSLTAQGEWPMEMKRRLVANNTDSDGIVGKNLQNITFCGSRTAEGDVVDVDYFGSGGKSWGWYLSAPTIFWYHVRVAVGTDIQVGAVYSIGTANLTVVEINSHETYKGIGLTSSTNGAMPSASGTMTKVSGNGVSSVEYTNGSQDVENPLWNPSDNTVTFGYYCGSVVPSVFCVLLSWNGQAAWKQYAANEDDSTFARVFEFARKLHTEYPLCKLYIMGIQLPSQNGGLAHDYTSDSGYSDCYGLTNCALNYNKALEDFCALDEFSGFCKYIPVAAQFDSENNMPNTTKKKNTRNTATETVGYNGVHPALGGYKQIADAVYRAFVKDFC